MISEIDIVFPVLHGTNGEDGTLQGFLELKSIPYIGCNVLASSTGMDKIIMKQILRGNNIPTVDFTWFYEKDWYFDNTKYLKCIREIGYPVIVKPSDLGSSIGISKANNDNELEEAINLAGSFSKRILVEKMIVNLKEINCSVIGDSETQQASVCEEPLKSDDILSYNNKYITKSGSSKGMSSTKRQIPADLSHETTSQIHEYAKKTFKVLDGNGVSRIDFMLDMETNNIYINEINTIPGSLAFYLWEASDKSYTKMIDELVLLALKRQRDKEKYKHSFNQNIFKLNSKSTKLGKS